MWINSRGHQSEDKKRSAAINIKLIRLSETKSTQTRAKKMFFSWSMQHRQPLVAHYCLTHLPIIIFCRRFWDTYLLLLVVDSLEQRRRAGSSVKIWRFCKCHSPTLELVRKIPQVQRSSNRWCWSLRCLPSSSISPHHEHQNQRRRKGHSKQRKSALSHRSVILPRGRKRNNNCPTQNWWWWPPPIIISEWRISTWSKATSKEICQAIGSTVWTEDSARAVQ